MHRLALVGLGLAIPVVAAAQWQERPKPTAAACTAVKSALQTMPLPQPGDSAWVLVSACDGGGSAFATAIMNVATSTDTLLLNQVLRTAAHFKDRAAFDAFRALASNGGATVSARAMALHGLILAHNPQIVLTQPITTILPADQEPCHWTGGFGASVTIGTPLVIEYHNRIASTVRPIIKNAAQPAAIRAAARCTYAVIRGLVGPDITTASLVFTYVCGNTFQVQNPNPDAAILVYTVVGTPERATIQVPAGKSTKFATVQTGTVKFYYGNNLIKTKENPGTPCPP